MKITKNISLNDINPNHIFGKRNDNLRLIENHFKSKITGRGDTIIIEGEENETEQINNLFLQLIKLAHSGNYLSPEDVSLMIDLLAHNHSDAGGNLHVVVSTAKANVKPRTIGQHFYVKSIAQHDIVFSIGPAGTGKTFLAVCLAVAALLNGSIDRIILTRPAIEAGENLGFLPGDLKEKVDPYLHPLYDALFDILPQEKINQFLSGKSIEIIPLGYMRGRTLNNAFIILDEAQNTTPLQMKMFLTRLGINSKAIITGDITQVDLAHPKDSGLVTIQKILTNISGIKFIYLDKKDIIRHQLVKDIVYAYEKHENNN